MKRTVSRLFGSKRTSKSGSKNKSGKKDASGKSSNSGSGRDDLDGKTKQDHRGISTQDGTVGSRNLRTRQPNTQSQSGRSSQTSGGAKSARKAISNAEREQQELSRKRERQRVERKKRKQQQAKLKKQAMARKAQELSRAGSENKQGSSSELKDGDRKREASRSQPALPVEQVEHSVSSDNTSEHAGAVENSDAPVSTEEVNEEMELLANAVFEHALYLGVDPEREPQLLPIVEEALLAPPPEDWQQVTTPEGENYFHNINTNETQWDHPLDDFYREVLKRVRAEDAAAAVSEEEAEKREQRADGALMGDGGSMKSSPAPATDQDGETTTQQVATVDQWDDWDEDDDDGDGDGGNDDNGKQRYQQYMESKGAGDDDISSSAGRGGQVGEPTTSKIRTAVAYANAEGADSDLAGHSNATSSGPVDAGAGGQWDDWDSDGSTNEDPEPAEQGWRGGSGAQDAPPAPTSAATGALQPPAANASKHGADEQAMTKAHFIAETEVRRLTAELERATAMSAHLRKSNDEIVRQHQSKLELLQQELSAERARNSQSAAEIFAFKEKLKAAEFEVNVEKSKHDDVLKRYQLAEERLRQAETTRESQLVSELTSRKQELEEELQRSTEQVQQLQSDLAHERTEIARLKDAQMTARNAKSSDSVARLKKAMDTARTAQAALKKSEDKLKSLQQQHDAERKQHSAREDELLRQLEEVEEHASSVASPSKNPRAQAALSRLRSEHSNAIAQLEQKLKVRSTATQHVPSGNLHLLLIVALSSTQLCKN